MLKKNKLIRIFFIIIITSILFLNISSICYADNEKVTKDLKLNGYVSYNNEFIYTCDIGKTEWLNINKKEFGLPSNLYDYSEYIRMRVTYSEEDLKVYDCKVINYKTGELIEDLSDKNINKLFNIEYGKNITEKTWSETIKLSELNENVIYKYKASSTTQFPKIENNTGKNCIVYIKEKDKKTYEKNINMGKQISSSAISLTLNEYNSGDTFCIMYKSLNNSELFDLVEINEIIYLSKYKDGDKLEYGLEKFVYNDTDQDIIINTKDIVYGVEKTNSVVIEKGEIYGFDWMIDSATISYEKNNNEQSNYSLQTVASTQGNDNIKTLETIQITETNQSNDNITTNDNEENKVYTQEDYNNYISEMLRKNHIEALQSKLKEVEPYTEEYARNMIENDHINKSNVKSKKIVNEIPNSGSEANRYIVVLSGISIISILGIILFVFVQKTKKNSK